jgi:integrase
MRRLAGDQYGAILELLIYTGQRRQQIAGLTSSMVDFATETMTWPADMMKTGKRHTIPFGTLSRVILKTRPVNFDALYFGSRIGMPFCGWSYHARKFEQEVGFGDWVVHDLRRTLATCWQKLGVEIATTEKMLSHSAVTGGLVGVYQTHAYLAEMRSAVQKWTDYLQALLPTSEGTNA